MGVGRAEEGGKRYGNVISTGSSEILGRGEGKKKSPKEFFFSQV